MPQIYASRKKIMTWCPWRDELKIQGENEGSSGEGGRLCRRKSEEESERWLKSESY